MSMKRAAPQSNFEGPAQAGGAAASPSPLRLTSKAGLEAGLQALADRDRDSVEALLAKAGRPALRVRAPGFEGLASIIVAQQVSTASAAAIFARLSVALTPFAPGTLRAADDDRLRGCGLSRGKVRTLRAVADAIETGVLPIDALAAMPAEDAHQALVAVKGIGPWTADVFLLFCLGHPDAFPVGDLALQEAARLLFGGERRPNAAELTALAERWRPYRGVAAYLLWGSYRAARGRSGMVLTPP